MTKKQNSLLKGLLIYSTWFLIQTSFLRFFINLILESQKIKPIESLFPFVYLSVIFFLLQLPVLFIKFPKPIVKYSVEEWNKVIEFQKLQTDHLEKQKEYLKNLENFSNKNNENNTENSKENIS